MRLKKGFTLVELLVVVLILAALAAIAIPRISQSASSAKTNACSTNVDLVNSQIELYYANEGSWPATLADLTSDANYFPDGAPVCPWGTGYNYNSDKRVDEHSH
ncbi:MAG: prepilin-type N-terminal cleavage/methylation domain-containing protein [Phycisphaerales bacterium]|nr:MAG: prepilin-type N-terminal cleavage/methylation domain-containing protein [Phycisphaerales bacterium]